MSSIGKVLDIHVFHDEANVLGNVLQTLTQVHKIFETRPIQPKSSEQQQSGVYPEGKAEDASQLLQLFLFPNNVNLDNLDADIIQVWLYVG